MATYRISGVWKNTSDVITHYSFHTVNESGTTRGTKTTKARAVEILETAGNSSTTWLWDYSQHNWVVGKSVTVVNGVNCKFLRSTHDNTVKDNLAHLIDYDWIST